MNIHSIYRVVQRKFRVKRMRDFRDLYDINEETKIIDIGGSINNWKLIQVSPWLTIINVDANPETQGKIKIEIGNGCNLKYGNCSFDVAYSNSVIEHVGNWNSQVQFANEIRRMAPSYYVQTPNRRFFFEPHLVTPFIHFFPKRLQAILLRNFTVWGLIARPSTEYVKWFLDTTQLLTVKQVRALFPDAEIRREMWLGMTKSIIATRIAKVSTDSRHLQ
jgi:Methyltransferase domain